MLRFLFGTLWKVFILFFAIHILSHWSEVEELLSPCGLVKSEQCQETAYYPIVTRVAKFSVEAGKASLTSLLEVVNFAIFVGKRSVFYVKSKTYYDKYLQDVGVEL